MIDEKAWASARAKGAAPPRRAQANGGATMTIEVATIAELQRWKRHKLIKTLEKIVGATKSGPDHVRLRRLFVGPGSSSRCGGGNLDGENMTRDEIADSSSTPSRRSSMKPALGISW